MKEIIKRNREALDMAANETTIDSFRTVNNILSVDSMIQYHEQGYEYILADGLIVGVE